MCFGAQPVEELPAGSAAFEGVDAEARLPRFRSHLCLCDLGLVTSPLWTYFHICKMGRMLHPSWDCEVTVQ